MQAPIEEVWEFLIDPRRVVVCLPGAEVTEQVDDRSYKGRVSVKLGPVMARFDGTVVLDETDEPSRTVHLTGQGKETGGSGSAKMSMTGRLTTEAPGKTQVAVDAQIDVAGKLARFGRGVMEDVSRQLFHEFAKNTQQQLEHTATSSARGPAQEHVDSAPPAAGRQAEANTLKPAASADTERSSQPATAAKGASQPGAAAGRPPAPPVRILSLLSRTIWSRLKRLLGQ